MSGAAWVPCPCCEGFLCTIHGGHASDCPCPPIEDWTSDPYSDPPMTHDLPDRLGRLLASRHLSIAEAARRAGMEKQQAWRIVTGDNPNPGIRTLARLVEGVGGSMAELFGDGG